MQGVSHAVLFCLQIANVVLIRRDLDGYAAFGCTTLSGDRDDWLCVSCSQAERGSVDLPASTEDKPTQFFMLFRVSGAIEPGTPLSALLENE